MHIRNYILLLLSIVLSGTLAAQGFISLDWKNPSPIYIGFDKVETDMPGFAGAYHYTDDHLPYYTHVIDLGRDYDSYFYDVKIEYPEFMPLNKKEIAAIEKSEVQLPAYPEVKTSVKVSARVGALVVTFVPLVYKDGTYQRINSFKLAFNKKEKPLSVRAATRSSVDEKYAENSVLASGKWVKIRVNESGVYQIANSELTKMGFSDPSKVKLYGYGGRLLYEDLRKPKIDDLQEVPLWREQSYVLFYGYGTVRWDKSANSLSSDKNDSIYRHTQNHYSTYGCYFLTEGDNPMAFSKENSLSEDGAKTVTTFPDYAVYEKEEFAWLEEGRKLFESYDYKNGNTKSYTFNDLTGITNDKGWITVGFSAYDKTTTSVAVSVNGSALAGNLTISAAPEFSKAAYTEKTYEWPDSKNAKTVVTLTHNRNNGISGRLDYIALNYVRNLALYNAYTAFRTKESGKVKFVIANANENAVVWDIANSKDYKQVVGNLSGNQYSFTCEVPGLNEFVVVNTKGNAFKKIEVVGEVPNQNLHQLRDVDMIIITPPNNDFMRQAKRLADAHAKYDDLVTEIVTTDQIYNEFSSGTPDGTAYRWLMKMLYERGKGSADPKYLLLFGDAAFDNRLLSSNWSKYTQNDFVLCYESVNSVSDTNSYVIDDYFGFLSDTSGLNINSHINDAPDIGVGRFPVRTSAQAKEVVDKIIAYIENKDAGSWKNVVCFLGDDGKDGDSSLNIHMEQADAVSRLAEKYNPALLVKRIYWDAYKKETTATGDSYPEITKRIMELSNDGLLFMNYVGHGAAHALSDELVLTVADVAKMSSPKAPFWVTAACEVTPFDRNESTFGEVAFLNPKGGAIGLLTTTRTVYADPNCRMDSIFVRFLFSKTENGYRRLGDAVRETKTYISTVKPNINNLQFVFLGDPALRLAFPEYKIVVDEFNGVSVEGKMPTIKAGGKVSVKGHILNTNGDLAEDFIGTVHPTVLDNEEVITTRNNYNKPGSKSFTYRDRTKTLFAGSDSVRSGRFEFQFPVPLDINYSNESGLLNLYAVNGDKTHEGQGVFTDFLIGGTEDGAMDTDSVGPKINLYLNRPDFVYGGKVNETPFLVAELEDEDGVNTVGNGIGHDLVAMIDNSPLYTYVLNNYYESVLGDYTKGVVRYSLPELPEGKHTLLFRAWDIKNNSSVSTLEFEVVKGLSPGLLDVTCTNSPAKEGTTFILSHDRPDSELDVNIMVCDFAGRTLWTYKESGVSSSNYYYIDWNLTTSGGQRLVPGIYLFKASVSSGGSKESTKAKKIVIVGQ